MTLTIRSIWQKLHQKLTIGKLVNVRIRFSGRTIHSSFTYFFMECCWSPGRSESKTEQHANPYIYQVTLERGRPGLSSFCHIHTSVVPYPQCSRATNEMAQHGNILFPGVPPAFRTEPHHTAQRGSAVNMFFYILEFIILLSITVPYYSCTHFDNVTLFGGLGMPYTGYMRISFWFSAYWKFPGNRGLVNTTTRWCKNTS